MLTADQFRYADHAIEGGERPRFPCQQSARDPANGNVRLPGVAPDNSGCFALEQLGAPE